jgi:hypothetical protein
LFIARNEKPWLAIETFNSPHTSSLRPAAVARERRPSRAERKHLIEKVVEQDLEDESEEGPVKLRKAATYEVQNKPC